MIRIALSDSDFRTLVSGGVVERIAQGNFVSGPTKIEIILSDIGYQQLSELLSEAFLETVGKLEDPDDEEMV